MDTENKETRELTIDWEYYFRNYYKDIFANIIAKYLTKTESYDLRNCSKFELGNYDYESLFIKTIDLVPDDFTLSEVRDIILMAKKIYDEELEKGEE